MPRQNLTNFIIISGSGKKVGKTFLATALIRKFSGEFPLLALKISPHVHDSLGNTRLRFECAGTRIFQELAPNHKNSGKFLEAGAMESFFMETDDEHLAGAFDLFMRECNPARLPVICESGALSRLVKPGILFFISRSTDDPVEHKTIAMGRSDLILPAKTFSTPVILSMVSFSEGAWQLGA